MNELWCVNYLIDIHRNMKKSGDICHEWESSFVSFRDWALASGYKNGFAIRKINPRGKYSPSNCRWSICKNVFISH